MIVSLKLSPEVVGSPIPGDFFFMEAIMINILADKETAPAISYLKCVFLTANGQRTLHQSKITDWQEYDGFADFAADFVPFSQYPREQSGKYETFSWVATLFEDSHHKNDLFKTGPKAAWRNGDYAAEDITLCYLDLDNQHADKTFVTLAEIHEVLTTLGVSHLLYTSFSHTPERHKVRVIMPINRTMTWDEAFLLFVWWNHMFGYQMDGSIYDAGDHLYAPPHRAEIVTHFGKALDVDAILADVLNLPDEALEYAKRKDSKDHGPARVLTPEQWEARCVLMHTDVQTRDNRIDNTDLIRPEWLTDFDGLYKGGSHRQSLFGTLVRVWLKSGCSLTHGDMAALQHDLDNRQFGYCFRTYGGAAMVADLKSIMKKTGTIAVPAPDYSKPATLSTAGKLNLLKKVKKK
jgi:hypothetical protein